MLTLRTRHPIQSRAVRERNRHEICGARGYCGPFLNRELYDSFPGWEGTGDCALCGSTVRVDQAGG